MRQVCPTVLVFGYLNHTVWDWGCQLMVMILDSRIIGFDGRKLPKLATSHTGPRLEKKLMIMVMLIVDYLSLTCVGC